MSVESVRFRLRGKTDWRSKMEMLKTIWTYLMDVGNELIPKKRYAFALGVLVALAGSWMIFG